MSTLRLNDYSATKSCFWMTYRIGCNCTMSFFKKSNLCKELLLVGAIFTELEANRGPLDAASSPPRHAPHPCRIKDRLLNLGSQDPSGLRRVLRACPDPEQSGSHRAAQQQVPARRSPAVR